MARELTTYESAETIDVSQTAQTPVNSSPSVKGPVVSDTYEERIEDSYKDTTAATGATHVQPPEAAEDDDELHALSPQGKASAAAAKASTKQSTLQNETRREDDIQPERRPSRATKSAETDKIPRDAIEDLLSKGATARPIYADRRQQKESDLRELAKPPPDKPRPTNGKLTGPGAESSKTARKATASTQPSSSRLKHAAPGKQTAKHKEADMSAPSVGTSSVAALRAKKDSRVQAQASTTDTNAALSAEVSEVARAAKASHALLKERSKNLQTPARTDPKTQASGHQPTAGKLQSRMFAQTPVSRPSASAQPELKRIAMDEQEVREDDVRDDDPPTKKVRGKTPIVTGTLKRPAKSSNMPTVMPRKSTYEVPDSPPNKASAAQVQRSYANAGSGMKTQSATAGKIVKPVKSSKEPILSKKAPVSKSKPSGPTSSAGQTRKQPARKAKAAVDSPSKQLQAEHEASLSSDQECHDAAGAKKQATVEGDRGVPETIEGFEQAVVDFSGEEEPTRAVSQVLGKAIGDIKVEQSRAAHGNTQPTRDRKQGASQENAIVLSDQPQSSSPPRSLSPQPSTAPPALNTVTGKGKQAVRPPQTPAAFGSSPPTNFQGSTLPTTAGSIDPYTARKSTIISFDRSGPRNQGSLSAKKSAPGSAWTVRTSLPPKRVPLASEAGSSHANLDARRKNRPLSAATSVKSTRMNRAAPPSTIVDDKDDALAGLHEKAKQNVPTPMKVACVKYTDAPRAREPLAPQHEMAADDGFMNIDEAKGTTLVEAELAGPPPPVPKSTIGPSASQLVMPPPAPKATKSRQIHRAPTVPSMLGPDGDQPEQHNHLKHGDDMGLKRARPEEHEAAPAVKRPKMTAAPAPAVVPIKPIAVALVQKEKSSDTTSKPVPGPTKRATRKPSRHASQGNVDIHGSPVPKGMLLMDNATVLESFSQQAGLSSDQIIADATAVHDRKRIASHQAERTVFDDQFLPPSHQPEVLSSNTKPRPASPEQDSQAITSIVIGRVDPKHLVIRDAGAPSATDPFTSSEYARKEPSKDSTSSIFAEQMRQQAAQAASIRQQAASDDPDKTLVEPEVCRKTESKRIESVSSDDSSETSASSDETGTTMRDIGIWRSALQPYQLNLFDELVIVSHRLMRSLIDRETASNEVVDDYRRRGTNLVEQMEQAHAQQYQLYVQELGQRKKRLRRELNKCSGQIKGAVAAVKEAKEKRTREAEKRVHEEQELRKLMADFC